MKSIFMDFKLENGKVIQLTLNFARLYKVKNKRKDLYERFMNSISDKKL